TGQSCSGIRNCQAQVESQEVGEEEENQAFRVKEVKEGWGGIAELDADKDVTLVDVDDTDEEEPAEVEEVLEVVTVVKLMTEVVTTATPITTAAQAPKVIAPRRRMSVVIQDPEETAATSVIVHSKVQSKDKGKGILIEEPKPLKGQAQIDMDEAFARQLEAELNANINWNEVIEQVKRKERHDNEVMRYQALKRKPLTEAQARKNMMIYLKNMAEFKMNFFKGMTYNEIRPIFEKHYNSIQAFLERVKEERMDEEAEELKRHLQIIPNDDDDVYTKATHLASKNFDREDLEALWKLVKERFESTEPKNFSDEFLLNTFKIMFEKPNIEANVWRDQKGRYGLAKVKSWKLFESCKVHVLTLTTTQMFLRVEKKIPLTHFTVEQMLNNVRLKVEEESEMSLEFLRLVRRQLNEGFGVDVVQDFKKNAKRLLLLVEELVLLVHIDVV
nr:hypothetical protein [Tanacetum cinerariifolium]